jgi:predicted nucleotidyltransferase/predicted transcriptional regulator
MWLQNPLDDILSSKAKVAVLRVVCGVNTPLSGREVARRAGISSGNASRVLGELKRSGVLIARDHGRVTTYELRDRRLPIIRELGALFAGESRRRERAVSHLVKGIPDVLSVTLFGSEARHEARPGSDTDVLIVLKKRTGHVEKRLLDNAMSVAEEHLVPLSWYTTDLAELRRWERTGNPLWRNILADGVTVAGQPLWMLQRQWQHGKSA